MPQLKVAFISFVIFILLFYALGLFNSIFYSHSNRIIIDNNSTQVQNSEYNDIFQDLESDIQHIDDTGYENSETLLAEEDRHEHETLDNASLPNNDFIANIEEVETDKVFYQGLQGKKTITLPINNNVDNKAEPLDKKQGKPSNPVHILKITDSKSLDVVDKTIKEGKQDHNNNDINNEESVIISSSQFNTHKKNQYVLSIQDALKLDEDASEDVNKRLKKEISSLYEQRRLIAKRAKTLISQSSSDIKILQKIFKGLGVYALRKFKNIKGKKDYSKILKILKISSSELSWRYPKLLKNLDLISKFNIYTSLLPFHRPIYTGRYSSNFGYRSDPFTKKRKMHSGIDFAARKGTKLHASGIGIVKYAGRRGGYGNVVEIYHGKNIYSRYAHLSKILVKKGQRILKGQIIGKVGSTGRSTGAHLHYEVRINGKAVNPANFLNKRKQIYKIMNKY